MQVAPRQGVSPARRRVELVDAEQRRDGDGLGGHPVLEGKVAVPAQLVVLSGGPVDQAVLLQQHEALTE